MLSHDSFSHCNTVFSEVDCSETNAKGMRQFPPFELTASPSPGHTVTCHCPAAWDRKAGVTPDVYQWLRLFQYLFTRDRLLSWSGSEVKGCGLNIRFNRQAGGLI